MTLWTIVWLVMCAGPYPARTQEVSIEYAVKATYLYKLAPFVAWPNAASEFPDGNFTICVIGNDPVGAVLEGAVRSQDIAGRPIVVRRYAEVTGNPGCAMMYVAESDAHSAASILAAVRGTPVLTVTDGATGAPIRGIVNFVVSDGHVRFEIDSNAAAANGLTISSKLLSLAVRVTGRG
jgi:hypothetical protein